MFFCLIAVFAIVADRAYRVLGGDSAGFDRELSGWAGAQEGRGGREGVEEKGARGEGAGVNIEGKEKRREGLVRDGWGFRRGLGFGPGSGCFFDHKKLRWVFCVTKRHKHAKISPSTPLPSPSFPFGVIVLSSLRCAPCRCFAVWFSAAAHALLHVPVNITSLLLSVSNIAIFIEIFITFDLKCSFSAVTMKWLLYHGFDHEVTYKEFSKPLRVFRSLCFFFWGEATPREEREGPNIQRRGGEREAHQPKERGQAVPRRRQGRPTQRLLAAQRPMGVLRREGTHHNPRGDMEESSTTQTVEETPGVGASFSHFSLSLLPWSGGGGVFSPSFFWWCCPARPLFWCCFFPHWEVLLALILSLGCWCFLRLLPYGRSWCCDFYFSIKLLFNFACFYIFQISDQKNISTKLNLKLNVRVVLLSVVLRSSHFGVVPTAPSLLPVPGPPRPRLPSSCALVLLFPFTLWVVVLSTPSFFVGRGGRGPVQIFKCFGSFLWEGPKHLTNIFVNPKSKVNLNRRTSNFQMRARHLSFLKTIILE